MRTLTEIASDSTKSTLEREMANSMSIYANRQNAINHHSTKMGIDELESDYYYDSVIESQYEAGDE